MDLTLMEPDLLVALQTLARQGKSEGSSSRTLFSALAGVIQLGSTSAASMSMNSPSLSAMLSKSCPKMRHSPSGTPKC